MRFPIKCSIVLAFLAAAVAAAKADTYSLELKLLGPQSPGNADYLYRATMPQHFFVQVMPKDKSLPQQIDQGQTAAFKKIVKKEPKYQSDRPFRGVAKLGSQEFAFALDATPPKPAEKNEKADANKKVEIKEKKPADAKSADKKSTEKKPKNSSNAKPKESSEENAAKMAAVLSSVNYDRLYFDFNHNGDLTDDKVVEAESPRNNRLATSGNQAYTWFQFPRLDVAIESGEVKMNSSFFLRGQAMMSPDFSYVTLSLNAGAYREGDITLAGKKRRVVLIDFNSNGRFDDRIRIRTDVHTPDGQLFPEQGDVLLIDPDASKGRQGSPYDVTTSDNRHYVSKTVNIDGCYYSLEISPAGDKLTLSPSDLPLGNVTNPNDRFTAVIYGDHGFLKIHGDKNQPIPVPAGEWKLLSYTINYTGVARKPQPQDKAKKDDSQKKDEKPKKDAKTENSQNVSIWSAFAKMLGSQLTVEPKLGACYGHTVVSAALTDKYKAVKVVKGETAVLAFGPPYKPMVKGNYFEDKNKQLSLSLSLIGSSGEIVSNMTIDGQRPSKPAFTITDAKKKVVQQGTFEYG